MTAVELLLSQRKSYYEGTEMVISGIRPELFDLRPYPESMSFGEQIDHMSAVESDTLGETAEALKFEKIDFGFEQSGNLRGAVDQWKRIHDLGDRLISRLDDKTLDFRFLTTSHVHVSVAQVISTVIEHELQHRGEIISYSKLIREEPPIRWKE